MLNMSLPHYGQDKKDLMSRYSKTTVSGKYYSVIGNGDNGLVGDKGEEGIPGDISSGAVYGVKARSTALDRVLEKYRKKRKKKLMIIKQIKSILNISVIESIRYGNFEIEETDEI